MPVQEEILQATLVASKRNKEAGTFLNNFNREVCHDPETVSRVIGKAALHTDITEVEVPILGLAEDVLDVTNGGTLLEVDSAISERVWAQVFEDPHHREANIRYEEESADLQKQKRIMRNEGIEDPETVAAINKQLKEMRRERGLLALRTIAMTHLPGDRRRELDNKLAALKRAIKEKERLVPVHHSA